MRKFLLILALVAGLTAGGAAIYWQRANAVMNAPGPHQQPLELVVKPGATVRGVLSELDAKGAINDKRAVELQLRVRGWPQIRTGRYEIPAAASPREILQQLIEGRVVLEALTVIEGWTFADMRRAVEAHPQIKVTLRGKDVAGVMSAIGHPGEHPEGRFFPDTYRFERGDADTDLLRRAHARMDEVLADAWATRAEGLPYHTSDEALIVASLVEKETGNENDRERIARVFVNRLAAGMRLQTDPTVIYGLGTRFDGNLTREHLAEDTPYNTYVHAGLPPSPIALPGARSIAAALHPAPGDYLYFVSRGDGTSHFSVTLEEHNRAVQRYQIP